MPPDWDGRDKGCGGGGGRGCAGRGGGGNKESNTSAALHSSRFNNSLIYKGTRGSACCKPVLRLSTNKADAKLRPGPASVFSKQALTRFWKVSGGRRLVREALKKRCHVSSWGSMLAALAIIIYQKILVP